MEIKLSNYNVGHELFLKIQKRKVTKDPPDPNVRCQCLNIWKGRNKVGEQKDVPRSLEKIEDEGETGNFDVYNEKIQIQIFICLPHLKERVIIEWMISWWTTASAVGSVKLLWLENERETLEFPGQSKSNNESFV